jgi:hypothetical protein
MNVWSPLAIRQYRQIIAKSRLSPQRVGSNPAYCDEQPLYSRHMHLGSIRNMPRFERESLILRMAVQFWLEAEANLIALPFYGEYIFFLSLWSWEKDDYPNPYIFFCGSNPRELRAKFTLQPATSELSSLIRSYLNMFEIGSSARLFEDHETVPGDTRILIDFDVPCNPRKLRFE